MNSSENATTWREGPNMKRRRFLSVMAGAASWLAGPSIARSQHLASVRIATGVTPPSIHNIFLHVAYERGFFRDNGIEVTKFIQLHGGPMALSAIVSGQVDVAPADPEGLLAATANGSSIRGVSAPGSRLSYMLAVRKEIETVADLRGKTFAISRAGAISQYLMYPLLDAAGVPRDSVQWVGVGGGHERMRFLQADRVKGALLNIDFAMHTFDSPNIKIIKSIADILPDYPVELLVLRKDMLEQNPEAATAIVRAVIQACRYIVNDKAGTIEVMLKYVPGMNVAVLDRALDELQRIRGFGVDGGMTVANLKVAHDLAQQNGQIARAMPLDQWVDFRFQKLAVASLGPFVR
jgi:NitT/TauT family transport system substrate-binding protein